MDVNIRNIDSFGIVHVATMWSFWLQSSLYARITPSPIYPFSVPIEPKTNTYPAYCQRFFNGQWTNDQLWMTTINNKAHHFSTRLPFIRSHLYIFFLHPRCVCVNLCGVWARNFQNLIFSTSVRAFFFFSTFPTQTDWHCSYLNVSISAYYWTTSNICSSDTTKHKPTEITTPLSFYGIDSYIKIQYYVRILHSKRELRIENWDQWTRKISFDWTKSQTIGSYLLVFSPCNIRSHISHRLSIYT